MKITSADLRQLVSIVERKERVQEELREIESQLSAYLSPEPDRPTTRTSRRARKSRAVRVSKQPLEVKAPKSNVQQAESKSGQRHGALKDSILAALQKQTEPVLPDLSKTLGAHNLHVWCSSAARKEGVTKVSAGRWAYKGN